MYARGYLEVCVFVNQFSCISNLLIIDLGNDVFAETVLCGFVHNVLLFIREGYFNIYLTPLPVPVFCRVPFSTILFTNKTAVA